MPVQWKTNIHIQDAPWNIFIISFVKNIFYFSTTQAFNLSTLSLG